MPKGISLHLGLNSVDPAHYGGWDGQLVACEFDANDMIALARKKKFKASKLLTRQATAGAVIAAIQGAAAKLKKGDIFFLTYSGHGGQVPDTNDEETDGQDETWVLYDRQLIDDELYALWSKFAPGVRIVMLSDSCHSGTVARFMPVYATVPGIPPLVRARVMPPTVARRTYKLHQKLYDGIQKKNAKGDQVKVAASVILISGCQDGQTSLDGDRNGLFTQTLKKVWSGGKFDGGYRVLRQKIVAKMPPTQTPNYFKTGAANARFEREAPFSI
jgi:hypothetical protein